MHKVKGMTDADRLSILEEYLCSEKSRYQIEKEKGLSCGTIQRWLRIFELSDKSKKDKMKATPQTNVSLTKENEALKLKIKQLEHALKEANMARDAYNCMIDLAESKYAIVVRKNSVAK